MKNWFEIKTHTTHEASEIVSDVLLTAGAEGVSVLDGQDVTDVLNGEVFWDYVDDEVKAATQNEDVVVSGYAKSENFQEIKSAVESEFARLKGGDFGINFGELQVETAEIDDEDWFFTWKKFYSPVTAGDFLVCPAWMQVDAEDKTVVKINPGTAFGTGEHESTKMCLMLLSEVETSGKDVIDVGAGSGILGISAVLKGAKSAYLTDIDKDTLKNAEENAGLNGVKEKCSFHCADLVKDKVGDVIFANITADVLIRLSETMGALCKSGTKVIMSGIINARYDEVVAAYLSKGFTLEKHITLGEWNAVRLLWK